MPTQAPPLRKRACSESELRSHVSTWLRKRIGSLDCYVVGDLDADATPLVLIHGLGTDGRLFVYQESLAKKRALVLPNLPSLASCTDRMESYAIPLCDMCHALGRPVLLGGVSMGGMVAIAGMAMGIPARGLVLISTTAYGRGLRRRFHWAARILNILPNASLSLLKRIGYFPSAGLGPLTRAELRLFTEMIHDAGIVHLRHAARACVTFDHREQLSAFSVPTLVIHGTHDGIIPFAHGADLAQRFPHARLSTIDGGGHAVIANRTEEVNREIEAFLDALAPLKLAPSIADAKK